MVYQVLMMFGMNISSTTGYQMRKFHAAA